MSATTVGSMGSGPPSKKNWTEPPQLLRSFMAGIWGGGNRLRQTGYTFLKKFLGAVIPQTKKLDPPNLENVVASVLQAACYLLMPWKSRC